jgi:DNA-binding winged helix-turn-helix (wHTH) protein
MTITPYRFDEVDRMLWRGTERVRMTRKARDLLACLVAAQGRFVSKAEILSTVWPDTHVLPENIKVLVHEIRSALADDSRNPQFIRSEAGLGYAFVAGGSDRDGNEAPGSSRHHPMFLNRNRELAVLAEAFEEVRTGSSRTVLVSGERGCGKTALCDVFVRLAAAGTPVRLARGRCIEGAGDTKPLLPFLHVLRHFEEQLPSRMSAVFGKLAPTWSAWMRSGATTPPIGNEGSLTAELRSLLFALAHDMPLIVVLEDLHCSDPLTARVVGELARTHTTGKWLLIATFEPAIENDGRTALLEPLMRRLLSALVVDLAPLSETQVARYLDARFGPGKLTRLAPLLHDFTGGNPSMMVAATDGLIANGVLSGQTDDCGPGLDSETVAKLLPYVLRDVIVEQLDRLRKDERTLLETASVVGLEFTASSVALASATDVRHVRRVLAPLAERGLIICSSRKNRAALVPDDLYRFHHPIYAQLLAESASIQQRFRATQRLAQTRDQKMRSA